MSKCPSCISNQKKKMFRSLVFKVFIKTKVYKCLECKVKYVKVPFLQAAVIIRKGVSTNPSLNKKIP